MNSVYCRHYFIVSFYVFGMQGVATADNREMVLHLVADLMLV